MDIHPVSGLLKFGFTVLLIGACAASEEAIVISASKQVQSAKTILDLPIRRAHIPGFRMQEALRMISEAIAKRSEGELHFLYGVTSSASRVASKTEHPLPPRDLIIRDPKVYLNMSNTTLRRVLDELCKQTGWSYGLRRPGTCLLTIRVSFIANYGAVEGLGVAVGADP